MRKAVMQGAVAIGITDDGDKFRGGAYVDNGGTARVPVGLSSEEKDIQAGEAKDIEFKAAHDGNMRVLRFK